MPNLFDLSSQRGQVDVAFADWLPDHPAFQNPGFPVLENAVPSDAGVFRPMPNISSFGGNTLLDLVPTLTAVVGDLRGFRNPDSGAVFYYMMARDDAGGSLHLFQFDESTQLWQDVTPGGGLTAGFDSFARFRSFGTEVYAAMGSTEQIHSMEIGSAGPFAPVSGAPSAKDLAIIRGFAVAIDIVDGSGREATKVSWSAQDNPDNWIDPIADPIGALSVLRGFIELEGGGRLKRIIPGVLGSDAIILAETAIWRMTFVGAPRVWDFRIIAEDEGTTVPTSVISSTQAIYFYGRRGWMRLDASGLAPIGAGKVNRAFTRSDVLGGSFRFDPSSQQGLERGIRAAIGASPLDENLVLYSYRSETDDVLARLTTSAGDTIVTSDGNQIVVNVSSNVNDTVLMFNELTGVWGNAKLVLTAIGRIETNRTADDTPELLGMNQDFGLVRFNGNSLGATFESAEVTGPVNNRVTVRRTWAATDAAGVQVSLLNRESLEDVQEASPPLVRERDQAIPVNQSGRYVAVRATIPNGASWSFMRGISVEAADQGKGGTR